MDKNNLNILIGVYILENWEIVGEINCLKRFKIIFGLR